MLWTSPCSVRVETAVGSRIPCWLGFSPLNWQRSCKYNGYIFFTMYASFIVERIVLTVIGRYRCEIPGDAPEMARGEYRGRLPKLSIGPTSHVTVGKPVVR